MKKVAIITSGGDSSGINAVFQGILSHPDIELWGFNDGYDGIAVNNPVKLISKDVKQRINNGVAMLRTARSKRTFTEEGRKEIVNRLKEMEFETLIVCGGEGSGKGADLISKEGMDTILIPMTIDNNIYGTDYTIGYHTAVNYIADEVKRIRQSAVNLPGRIFMVETFGGDSGQLTLAGAISGGADIALIPEIETNLEDLYIRVNEYLENQGYCIILNTESNCITGEYTRGRQGVSMYIGNAIENKLGIRVRYSILGYTQRAGDAIANDVFDAIKIGQRVSEEIINGTTNIMVGLKDGATNITPLEDVFTKKKEIIEINKKIALNMKIIK